jgi:GR25 family glycosyltransferase involved in LPS biosynthesis
MTNLNIFIIHSASLINRLENIKNLQTTFENFKKFVVKFEIIEDYPFEQLDGEKIKNLIKLEPIQNETFQKYNGFLRNLTPQSVSRTLKHYKCLQEIKKKNLNDINIVIEDDVSIENEKFEENLSDIISRLDKDFNICFLGLPSASNLIEKNKFNIIDSKLIYNTLPGVDSYIISNGGATKLLNDFIPIKFDLNIQFSYIGEKNNILFNQISPNIMVEGSKIGKYKSTTNINNIPLYNFKYKELNNLIVKADLNDAEKKTIEELLKDTNLLNNPDFLYLQALYLFKKEQYKESLEIFNKVYEIYKSLNLQVNKDSNFMNNYTEIFKFVQ